jgi:hypothetical protein
MSTSSDPLVGDLISVRFRGTWYNAFVTSVEGRNFKVRFFDESVNEGQEKSLTNSSFQDITQKGWQLHKIEYTLKG